VPIEVKVDGAGHLPEYSTDGAAGADLRARESAEFRIEPGDPIGQLLVQKVERASFSRAPALAATSRGEGGFGSTGR